MHLRRIKLLAVLAPISGLTAFEVFRHIVLHPALGETGPHVTEHLLSAAVVIAGALAFTFLVFRLLERLHGQLVALNEAAIAVSSDLSLEGVLAQVAVLARQVAGVPHASVVIAGPPRAEVASGTAPLMGAQLEIAIVARGTRLGELRLTAEPRRGFRPSDRNALTVFATQAGVAIENARLFARIQELVRMRERERIGMDLHDGVVQNLYGLGLKIEDAIGMLDAQPAESRTLLSNVRADLRRVIGDVRSYVYDLHDGDGSIDLRPALERVAAELDSAQLDVHVDVQSDVRLPAGTATHVVHVAREAIANAARHARASRAVVRAARTDAALVVEVEDDGCGFDPLTATPGLGLNDMRDRAAWCRAAFEVRSSPGTGTLVRLALPLDVGRVAVDA
jgi:signal transduction histidine kinase